MGCAASRFLRHELGDARACGVVGSMLLRGAPWPVLGKVHELAVGRAWTVVWLAGRVVQE